MSDSIKKYNILPNINSPKDLKSLDISELSLLCSELREYIIETVKKTGGHLAPSLGTVELTVATHYVFDAPNDKLIWDVGHQAYSHKIITGRREAFKTLRQLDGISGFCKISESEYDTFGAGHAGTSISAAVGFATARDLRHDKNRVITIIGDGALSNGLAYEGLNNICNIKSQFLVILNDNKWSISPNVGAMSNYLTRILTNPKYIQFKNQIWNSLTLIPKGTSFLRKSGRKALESLKNFVAPGILFEELGFKYYGPIDGHDLEQLILTLRNIKDLPFPVLLHVNTKKGKGLSFAEENPTKFHGVGPYNPEKIQNEIDKSSPPFLEAFGKVACEIARGNRKAIFITAAMKEGTGLVEYAEKFPDRFFDVGIAEGHAVTFATGLAASGYRPVVAIYSTFLQRAYDHIIHDVALQNLPVIFALDRAGLVGSDGPTHHGAFDLSYLNTVPNMIIAAPRNGNELFDLMNTAFLQDKNPFAIRYPKDSCEEFDEHRGPNPIEIGSWEKIKEGKKIAIISVGTMTNVTLKATESLEKEGIHPTVIHARFIKPIDEELLLDIANSHPFIITLEENSYIGGFGMTVIKFLSDAGAKSKVYSIALPDEFIEQGPRSVLLEKVGLSQKGIIKIVKEQINKKLKM
jgi:1-deoxy-D-xylulose-5-phosphate synthase